ncbi:MAG: iron-sulfur cluster assembly scaffold protein [Chlamydiae bacterium]|nr:iron-sulfur cluster assembly scaffold protein [Chlamydiota bacterium]
MNKLKNRILNPQYCGFFSKKEARKHDMEVIVGEAGSLEEGNKIALYWLVDKTDGVVADAKFQVLGNSVLIGIADMVCELVIRKTVLQAGRISAEIIEHSLRDKQGNFPAIPEEAGPHLNLVLEAVDDAAAKCKDFPVQEFSSPLSNEKEMQGQTHPSWGRLSQEEKIALIQECIEKEIQPYIELDAGGVEVINLVHGREVIIKYHGSCTTCYSATGATLNAIQQILRAKISPDLEVIPDISTLQHLEN